MKLPGNSGSLSKSILGYSLFLVIVVLNTLLSLYYYSGYSIGAWSTPWKPGKKCTGFAKNYSETVYIRSFEDQENFSQIVDNYILANGVSGLLVSVLYPFLAIFLMIEIGKSAKFAAESLSKRSSMERHRTGRMILVMTIFYVIASAPGGASDFVQLFVQVKSNSILETLVGYGSIFISALFCFNATSHGVINFSMSSKYRNTVKTILCLKKKDNGIFSITRSSSDA